MDLLHAPEEKRACYSGLQTCGSVWACPICAAKVTERRRLELAAAIAAWEGDTALVTYTIRHKRTDDLETSVEGLLKARRAAKSGKAAKTITARHGIAGTVRALEVTHGSNGWHPHVHELVFLETGSDLRGLETDLRNRWGSMVGRAGLRDVNEHGVDLRLSDMTVAEYVAKFGRERTWGPEHEVTKQPVKAGRLGSRTPINLLADFAFYGDDRAGNLWRTYAKAFKGKRHLVWSFGLRERLLGTPAESDADLADDINPFSVLLASLNRPQWRVVLANDARAELVQLAGTGDAGMVWNYLRALGCEVSP